LLRKAVRIILGGKKFWPTHLHRKETEDNSDTPADGNSNEVPVAKRLVYADHRSIFRMQDFAVFMVEMRGIRQDEKLLIHS
jgi:hypothetical protein